MLRHLYSTTTAAYKGGGCKLGTEIDRYLSRGRSISYCGKKVLTQPKSQMKS